MPRFRRRAGQTIVVHERLMLFEFDIDPTEGGVYMVCFYIPVREPDGTFCGADAIRMEEIKLGEKLDFEVDFEGFGLPSGMVGIEILGDRQGIMDIDVEVPPQWKAVTWEEFKSNLHEG